MLLKKNVYFYLYLNFLLKKNLNFDFIIFCIIYLRILILLFFYFQNPDLCLSFFIKTKIIGVAYCDHGNDLIAYAEESYQNNPNYYNRKYQLAREKTQIRDYLLNLKPNCEKTLSYNFEVDRSFIGKDIYHNSLKKKIESLNSDYCYKEKRSTNDIKLSKSFPLKKYINFLNFKIHQLNTLKNDSIECCIKTDIKTELNVKISCLNNCSSFHSFCFSEINKTTLELNKLQSLNNKFSFLPKKLYFFIKKY